MRMDNSAVVVGQGFAVEKFDEEAFVDIVRN
jgi:hypothetical protein